MDSVIPLIGQYASCITRNYKVMSVNEEVANKLDKTCGRRGLTSDQHVEDQPDPKRTQTFRV